MNMRLLSLIVPLALAVAMSPLPSSAAAGPGSLIKLGCPAGAGANHPCRAVYYWGGDGKRHAFPNERTYFSWYADFSAVQTVDATALASLMLGPNITYRPGLRLLKFPSEGKVYAVARGGELRWMATEAAAANSYGSDWNRKIDDLSEAFAGDYRIGTIINTAADYSAAAELAAAPTIDADAGATYESRRISTPTGAFDVQIITLDRTRYKMKSLVDAAADCSNDCAAKPLADYAKAAGAGIAIHGTYFCPPDYADCAAKTYSFLWPVYDSSRAVMRNADNIKFHEAPIIASYADGSLKYYRRANAYASLAAFEAAYGSKIEAAIANYPGLVDGGVSVVESEPRLESAQRTVKGTRGGIGFNDQKIFLAIAKSATVIDLANIMLALGATEALNLDGGGSSALIYGGVYKTGPGRLLPNALVFVRR
ncbi:MAG: phosphodiester glycosidase family protein [Patescibacteria group bacterium]|jgi:hypothetical protein